MALLYWVFSITQGESPMHVAAITVATSGPALLLGLTAGTLADRWERRAVLISCDALRSLLSLLLLAGVMLESLPLVYVVAFCSSAVEQLYDPARAGMIRQIIPREDLVAASSVRQTTMSAIMLMGMAVGTGIYFALGPKVSFLVDAASFGVAALLGTAIRARSRNASPKAASSVLQEARQGLGYVRSNRFVLTLVGLGVVAMAASGLIEVVQLYLVTQDLGQPEARLAWLGTALGVSMFVGFMSAGLWNRWVKLERLPGLGLAVLGLGVAVLALAPSLQVAVAGMVLVGLGNVLFNVGLGPLLQTYVDMKYLGRVMGVFRSLSTASMLVGASLAGYLTGLVGPRPVIGAAGLLLWLAALEGGRRLVRSVVTLRAEAEAAAPVVPSASVK